MNEWLNNIHEDFIERFLRQRIEKLESSLTGLFESLGFAEDLDSYVMNRNLTVIETSAQYQLRCRLEVIEQRYDRLQKNFKTLESDAMNEAMRRLTDWWNMNKAS